MQHASTKKLKVAALLLLAILALAACTRAPESARPPEQAGQNAPSDQAQRGRLSPVDGRFPPAALELLARDPVRGRQAPAFAGVDVFTGETVSRDDLAGQVVFLNFWATWCPPCRLEMPHMQALHEEMGDRVRIVAIGADPREAPPAMQAFAEELGLSFTILFDEAKAMDAYDVQVLPTSFFIDSDGIIRARHRGTLDEEWMRAYLYLALEQQ